MVENLATVQLSNGEVLGYRRREGDEKSVLLVHGNMTSSKHWDLLIERLDKSYDVYAIDMRGFGVSSYDQPIESIKDFADDLALFVESLELQSFTLIGWSTGGAVSMQFTIDYPQYVKKLVLIASASTRGYPFYGENRHRVNTKEEIAGDEKKTIPILTAYQTAEKNFLKQLWNSVIYTNKQPDEARYDEYLEDMLTQRNLVDCYHALNQFNISAHHNGLKEGTNEARNINVPTLILSGEMDLVVTESMTKELVADLEGDIEWNVLKGCGHSPLIDDLEQLVKTIERFIENH